MAKVVLVVVGMFVLASCASGLNETEVRELIQAEIAAIPPECHTHDFEIGYGYHSHSVINGEGSAFGYYGQRTTGPNEVC